MQPNARQVHLSHSDFRLPSCERAHMHRVYLYIFYMHYFELSTLFAYHRSQA